MLLAIALHDPHAHLHLIWIAFVTAVACGVFAYLLSHVESLGVFAGGAILFCLLALITVVVQFFSMF